MHSSGESCTDFLRVTLLLSKTAQIYHPNVDLEGNVCLNILREDWKPVLNLNSVMVGLQYLFLEPNADDPLNKRESALAMDGRYRRYTDGRDYCRGGRAITQEPRPIHPGCQVEHERR